MIRRTSSESECPRPLAEGKSGAGRRFVFLDRDGTINAERHYLTDPGELQLLPRAAEGLRELAELGLGLIVVTNQSGIGRQLLDESKLQAIHERLRHLLRCAGVELDAIYFCPHLPADQCACRKPGPGMLQQAVRDFGMRLEDCFVIGDKACDVALGHGVGATSLLVETGYGKQTMAEGAPQPAAVVADLLAASSWIGEALAARSG